MNDTRNQQITGYFAGQSAAQAAAAELQDAGIDRSSITLHDRDTGGGGFFESLKHFFEGNANDDHRTGTLLSVTGSRDLVEPILLRNGAQLGSNASSTAYDTDRSDGDADRTMQLREERLSVDKQNVQAGEVRLGKEVVTERQSIDVPVAHEEVYVSQRPVRDGEYADAGEIGDDSEISVPVMREEIAVEKHAVVTSEVGLTKQTVRETQTIDESVKKERATVEADGDVASRGNGVGR